MERVWTGWPTRRLQTWDPDEQAAARLGLENELPPVPSAEVRVQGWFELPWADQACLLRVYADRWPSVDVYEAEVVGGRPVAGAYLESWRLPGELDGYPPAQLAAWVWHVWELSALTALQAASEVVSYSSEATRYRASSRVGQG